MIAILYLVVVQLNYCYATMQLSYSYTEVRAKSTVFGGGQGQTRGFLEKIQNKNVEFSMKTFRNTRNVCRRSDLAEASRRVP